MNLVVEIGRLVADPELKQTPTNVSVCRFTIAVDRPFIKGHAKETDFFNVVVWRQTAEFLVKNFRKGSPIEIQGELRSGNYTDKNGNKIYYTEIYGNTISFCIPNAPRNSTPEIPYIPDEEVNDLAEYESYLNESN